MSAVRVDSLVVRFGSHAAVDGLSLHAEAGEVLGVLGPNGAGKTTTVETIEGYRRPDAGTVRVLGMDPAADQVALARRLGAMPQAGRLYAAIRPIEAVRLFASYHEKPADPDALLARVGLTGRRARTPWRRLSGGEQQRLSLALALVGRPEVVILDEPTAGLDVEGRQLVRSIVAELKAEGCCVLVTTHELDEADRMADRLVVIDGGRVVAAGSPAELAAQAGPPEIRFEAASGLDVVGLGDHLGFAVREESPGRYVAASPPSPANVARLTAWLAERDIALGDLQAGRQRLEDVFLRLTRPDGTGDGEHQEREGGR